MKKHPFIFTFFALLLLVAKPGISQNFNAHFQQPETEISDQKLEKTPLSNFISDTIIDANGDTIIQILVPGYPPGNHRAPVAVITETATTLPNVPAYDWSFGCSATAAAMMAGYYDQTGYPNMYTGPTNGGVAPMTNEVWGSVTINGEIRKQCPISATRQGLDGRTEFGHVDDYWIVYGSSAPDPYIGNWPQHTYGDCTGDFMKTNQSVYDNTDGSTRFYYYLNGNPYNGTEPDNGGYGLKLFFESRDYTVDQSYTQLIYGYNGNTLGFTFEQFKQEIDQGRPVMIHVTGHSMLGYGYDEADNKIYIHDTWDYSDHEMIWGDSYEGMSQYAVSIIHLSGQEDYVILDPASSTVGTDGGSLSIDVSSNISWAVTENCNWLSCSPISGNNDGEITVSYSENTNIEPRSCTITVSGGNASATFVLTQNGQTPYITLNPEVGNVDAEASVFSISVSSNVSWTVEESCDWLSCTPTSGTNNGIITIDFMDNPDTEVRNCTINVTSENAAASFILTQNAATPYITLNPESAEVDKEAGSVSLNVSSNINWLVEESCNWINCTPESGTNNDLVTINYSANTAVDPRTCEITVGNGSTMASFVLSQAGSAPFITLSADSVEVDAEDGNISLTVFSNISWTVEEDSDWLSCTPASGENVGVITLNYEGNPVFDPRSCTITIGDGNISASFVLTQAGIIPYITLNPASAEVESGAGEVYLTVFSNLNWTVEANCNWISASPSSGENDRVITINYSENPETIIRSCTITIGDGNSSATFNLSQAGSLAYIWLEPALAEVNADAGQIAVSVSSNVNWVVTETCDWISCEPTSGEQDNTFWINYEANTEPTIRIGVISIGGNGVVAEFVIEQDYLTEISDINVRKNIRTYPNPISEIITLTINDCSEKQLFLNVLNLLGNKLLETELTDLQGKTIKQLELSALPAGVYVLQLYSSSGLLIHSERIIKK